MTQLRRRWTLASACLLLALTLVVSPVHAQPRDEQPSEEKPPAPVEPPSIAYGNSRASRSWLELKSGSRVAVDEGIQWRGVRVYLALTWHLVAVDAQTNTVLWDQNVSAFWNRLTFREVTPRGTQAAVWAVELAPMQSEGEGSEKREYYDLSSGRRLDVGEALAPEGTAIQPRLAWSGDNSRVAKPFHILASTTKDWAAIRERMFGAQGTDGAGEVDFEREVVLLVSAGNSWNTSGLVLDSALESDARVLARVDARTFQTLGGGMRARPWGAFVLPRCPNKAYVVERDHQTLIGGPELWREVWRQERFKEPEQALSGLPAAVQESHHGSDQR